MSLLIGIIIGIISGLIPGLHSNLILMALASLFHVDVITIVTAYGCSLYTHRLSHVFHPTATTNFASLDPAQRLMHKGKGPEALAIMLEATTKSTIFLTILLIVIAITAIITRLDLTQFIYNFKSLGLFIVISWIAFTCMTSKYTTEDGVQVEIQGKTFIGFCLTGTYGYYILHAPTFRGSEFAMLIILNGLVAIPIIYQVLTEKTTNIPIQMPAPKVNQPQDLTVLGTITGLVSALIAGIGSSSMVTLFQHKTESDQQYIYLAACAETANNLLAFILVVLLGITRSGEAVLIKQVTNNPTIDLFLWLGLSMVIGYKTTTHLSKDYVQLARKIPTKVSASVVGLIALTTIYMSGHILIGLVYVAIGTAITLWCRQNKLPNQVLFGCMIIPIIINQLGITRIVNQLLLI